MKKRFLTAIILTFLPISLTHLMAQVTIGALVKPDSAAVLDLQSNASKGLLLPRVELVRISDSTPLLHHVAGMTVYNTISRNDVTPGYYYDDGAKWVRLFDEGSSINLKDQWFYMPSFNLPLSDPVNHPDGKGLTFDLYQEYYDQFNGTASQTTPPDPSVAFFAAAGDGSAAPTSVTTPYLRNQLIFYVTAYSHNVIKVNSISTTGVLNYDVVSGVVPDGSFINVIFKVINK